MRHIRKDEVDLHRTSQHQHPAVARTEWIPLLRDGLERPTQVGKVVGDSPEIATLDKEVPVRPSVRPSFGPRTCQPYTPHRRMTLERIDDAIVEAPHQAVRTPHRSSPERPQWKQQWDRDARHRRSAPLWPRSTRCVGGY